MQEDGFPELEIKLGYTFRDKSLLLQALTHKSYANENRPDSLGHNERLEFLGDTVLDFIVSDYIMKYCPESPEGELSRLRAVIVSETSLVQAARVLGIGDCLLLGRGEEQTGGREKSSLLANAYEAVIAAVYLDSGMDEAYRIIKEGFEAQIKAVAEAGRTYDSKTELQEQCQSRFGSLPKYTVVRETGPDHQKVFEVEIEANGVVLGRATGRSKKEAEQRAAGLALEALKKD